MAEQGAITALIRRGNGYLVAKIASNFDSLGGGYRTVLKLPSDLVLERGDVIELIWERESDRTPIE
jgi:hypothetical protein